MTAAAADLRAAVHAALASPDLPGVPPAEQAIPIAAGRWAEAAAITADLAQHDPSERVRVHAVQAWPRLLILGGGGDMAARVAPFRAGLAALIADRSAAVRAAAVTARFEFAAPHELAELRRELGRFGADLAANLGQWKVAEVLPRALGADATRAVLDQVAPGADPPGFAELYRGYVAELPAGDLAPAVEVLAAASPARAVSLVAELVSLGARGADVLAAVTADPRLDRDLRRVAADARGRDRR